MKKIKVAHLLHVLGPAGKEKGVLKIVSGMDKSRFEVDLIVLRGIIYGDLINLESQNVIELERVRGNSIKQLPQLINILRKNRYDIIYTHSWNTLVEGYLAALSAGIPVKIHGEHGTFEQSYLKNRLQKFLWKRFDSITVVVGDLEKKLREIFNYNANNIHIIYNGTDNTQFYPSPDLRKESRKKYGLGDSFLVGTIGRFYMVKDHFTLIRGFKHFRSLIPNTKLVLVGGGGLTGDENKKRYDQLIKELGLTDDVIIIPPVANPQALMNTFDIFVLSSISEGCSNVILEAMACGIPLVVTDTGGNPELVSDHDNGLLFEVGNDKELAEKLQYLYEHPEVREKFSRRGIELIKEKFSLKKTIFSYENLFSELYHKKMNGKLF